SMFQLTWDGAMWTTQVNSGKELLSAFRCSSAFAPRPAAANLQQLSNEFASRAGPNTYRCLPFFAVDFQAVFEISCFLAGWYLPGTLLAAIANRFQELMAAMASVRSESSFSLKCRRVCS